MMKYFNQTNITKESFLSEKWPPMMLHIVHNYIRYMMLCEFFLESCSSAPTSDGLAPAMNFLEDRLSELNISFNELGLGFGRNLASLLLLTMNHSWMTDNGTLLQKAISSRLVNREIDCMWRPLHDAIILSCREWQERRDIFSITLCKIQVHWALIWCWMNLISSHAIVVVILKNVEYI